MRILIVGAGALGGLIGANLTESGEDVTFVEINKARAKLINDMGLLISEADKGETCMRVHVATSIEGMAPVDLVFISVKSF